jgi:hypothetical protein
MHVVQVIIDRTSPEIIQGVRVFDRANGGILVIPHGVVFPGTTEADELFWRDDEALLYKRNSTNTAWEAAGGVTSQRLDGFDNATDYIALGAAVTYRSFEIEYTLELPVSHRCQVGTLRIAHADGTAEVIEHEYSYDEPEITGLTWGADIDTGVVRLVLTKLSVGENPTLQYRVHPVAVA